MNKNDKIEAFSPPLKLINNINDKLYKRIDKFINILENKLNQISTIKKNKDYKISNENIIKINKFDIINNIRNIFYSNNEDLYNFIRTYIDHCINISQIICSDINNLKHNNIYKEQYGHEKLIQSINSTDINFYILYQLTVFLSNSINGLNNIKINNYYNILIFDIKKIVLMYILNNLKYLFQYWDSYKLDKEQYNILLTIQNNVIYNMNINLINTCI